MPSDVYRKYLPPCYSVILTQMTLTRKQSNISLLRQLPGLSSLRSPYIAIPVFQPFPCTLTLSGHSLCYFTHHACHLHSTEPCLKILPLVHFRGKWPPRSLACCLQFTIECLKLPSACLHFPIIWLVTRGHYQPEALHRTMDSWCHLVVGFQVLPCVPPFNLGCHNQTESMRTHFSCICSGSPSRHSVCFNIMDAGTEKERVLGIMTCINVEQLLLSIQW